MKMVTVNGVRYRPEDAERLKVREAEKPKALSTKAVTPRNKAKTAKNK